MSGFVNDEPSTDVLPLPTAPVPVPFPVGAYPEDPSNSMYAEQFVAITRLWGRPPALQVLYVNEADPWAHWSSEAAYYASELKNSVGAACIPCVGMPMFSTDSSAGTSDSQLQAIAAGTYDSVFTSCMDAYTQQGYTTQVWRLGWEMNLNGGPWYAIESSNSGAYWIAAFQHMYTIMHAHATSTGVTLNICWNPGATSWSNAGNTQSVFWPGAAYVDSVGLDIYNWCYPPSSGNDSNGNPYYWDVTSQSGVTLQEWILNPANRENYWMYPGYSEWGNGMGSNAWGLADTIALAKANNLPIALPEMGVLAIFDGVTGVPDDADFPLAISNFLQSSGVPVSFINTWDAGGGANMWSLINTQIPNTQKAFVAAYGTGVTQPVTSIALDGGSTNNGSGSSVVISTTQTADVVFLVSNSSGGTMTAVTDTAGLTWQRYFSFPSTGNYMDVWYAVAANPLTSDTITATGSLYELQAFAFSGVDTASPFQVPYVTQTASATPASIVTTGTAMVVGLGNFGTASSPTMGTGFTEIWGENWQLSEYQFVTAAETVSVGGSPQAYTNVMAAFALSPAPTVVPVTPDPFQGSISLAIANVGTFVATITGTFTPA